MGPRHLPNLRHDGLLLFSDERRFVQIIDLAQHSALHDRPALVILDIPSPHGPIERNVLGEALLLKVPDGIVVRVGQEMHHVGIRCANVGFEVVHEHCAVALRVAW